MSKVDIERVLTQGNPDGLTQEQIKQAIDDIICGVHYSYSMIFLMLL